MAAHLSLRLNCAAIDVVSRDCWRWGYNFDLEVEPCKPVPADSGQVRVERLVKDSCLIGSVGAVA
jgi:hypothetical protein